MRKFLSYVLFLMIFCSASAFAQTSKTGRVGTGPLADRPSACNSSDQWNQTDSPYAVSACGPNNIWTNIGTSPSGGSPFIGPNPWYDVTNSAYGARPQSTLLSTTAACNGTTTVVVSSITGFFASPGGGKPGDGVAVRGCGATETMTTPSAPTVTSGVAQTQTTIDGALNTLTGSTSIYYKMFAIDQNQGLTVAGTPTHITNGLASLGMNTVSVTSASLSGDTLTLTLPATNSLAQYDRVNFRGCTDADLTGSWLVSSVAAGGETITLTHVTVTTTSATPTTCTGGTLTWAQGEKLSWTPGAGEWERGICKSTDGTTYHLIGLSLPVNSAGYASSGVFVDWGSTITSVPQLPSYLGDAACGAGSATNDVLVSTIVSFTTVSSQPAMVLANAASQTTSSYPTPSVVLLYNDEPAFAAAATAASNSIYGILFIPEQEGLFYHLTSRWTSPGDAFTINQQGYVYAYETIVSGAHWIGSGIAANSANQFPASFAPAVICSGAWPCVYSPFNVPFWDNLQFDNASSGNQGLTILFDPAAGRGEGGNVTHITTTTASSTDYSGVGLMIRAGVFNFTLSNWSVESGPNNSAAYINTTWTPNIYFDGDPNPSVTSVVDWTLEHFQGIARSFYANSYCGTGQNDVFTDYYGQGPIMPMIEVNNRLCGNLGVNLRISELTSDTSPVANVSLIGEEQVNLTATSIFSYSGEAGGFPAWLAGGGLLSPTVVSANLSGTPPFNNSGIAFVDAQPTFPTPVHIGDSNIWNGYQQINWGIFRYCGATSGGTQACSGSLASPPVVVFGEVTLNSSSSQSITTLPFTATTYSCSGSDLTAAAGIVSFNTYATGSVTIAESGGGTSDHLRYMCVGY